MNINSVGKLLLSIGATAVIIFGLASPNLYKEKTPVVSNMQETKHVVDEDLQKENIDIISVDYDCHNNKITEYIIHTKDSSGKPKDIRVVRTTDMNAGSDDIKIWQEEIWLR